MAIHSAARDEGHSRVVGRQTPKLELIILDPPLEKLYEYRLDFNLHKPMPVGVPFDPNADYPQAFTDDMVQAGKHRILWDFRQKFSRDPKAERYVQVLSHAFDYIVEKYRNCATGYHDFGHTLETVQVGQILLQAMDAKAKQEMGRLEKALEEDPQVKKEGNVFTVPYDISFPRTVSASEEASLILALIFHDSTYVAPLHADEFSFGDLTLGHEERAAEEAKEFLRQNRYEHLIYSELVGQAIAWTQLTKETIGKPLPLSIPAMAGAADLLAQCSAPNYLNKLPYLYKEFVEAGLDRDEKGTILYTSASDLIAKTPGFIDHVVLPRLANVADMLYEANARQEHNLIFNLRLNRQYAEHFGELASRR